MDKEYYTSYATVSKQNKSNTSTLKKQDRKVQQEDATCCKCLSAKTRTNARAFFAGLATNLGICVLLFGYTLIGSIIFLTIEGGSVYQYQQILATTANTDRRSANQSTTSSLTARNDRARAKTVENIWEITYSLNILYRDNWTRLAAMEITRFQDELIKNMEEETAKSQSVSSRGGNETTEEFMEWTFAKAFLYSLTVLTTIGYGSIAPKTNLGKIVTMIYALFGIPLTLLYLSSIGSILSRVARGVFSRALCCCLCSNCGYCCYDEKKMLEKERRKKRKRQQMEMQQQLGLQEPFYVRSNTYANSIHSPNKEGMFKELDSLSATDNESKISIHGCSILAPVLLCLCMMFIYICIGTFVLFRLENWSLLDGFYFCFMSLTTIGFGNMIPGNDRMFRSNSNATIWFCSIYIVSGMALTAMCFNVVHDEIVHRLRHHQEKMLPKLSSNSFSDDVNVSDPYNITS
ncbi:TWiK family of potassium channels protein 7 [Harmonia axyridis]|uniref:TWiK family of potassium channels protein 7 n=1 Tax=Harmonia axyridis TaxID=115357 RepID=UPI001E27970C|nr:TWiK family of potassium channels protein 7 [Harmonia axyridis]